MWCTRYRLGILTLQHTIVAHAWMERFLTVVRRCTTYVRSLHRPAFASINCLFIISEPIMCLHVSWKWPMCSLQVRRRLLWMVGSGPEAGPRHSHALAQGEFSLEFIASLAVQATVPHCPMPYALCPMPWLRSALHAIPQSNMTRHIFHDTQYRVMPCTEWCPVQSDALYRVMPSTE